MSKIFLFADQVPDRGAFIKQVRTLVGKSIAELVRDLDEGRPFAEFTLFRNDQAEVANRIRHLIDRSVTSGATLHAVESQDWASPETLQNIPHTQLTIQVLRNILDEADRRRRGDDW